MSMKTRKLPFDLAKAKAGAKIVTRRGLSVRIGFYDFKVERYPILGAVLTSDGTEIPILYTKDGKRVAGMKGEYDLFIEEEVEETDNYNPYKEVVKSISDMVEIYAAANGNLRDFYNEVKVKCREAVEYDKKWRKKQEEQKPSDKVKTRRMTNQELSWWLRDCPDEYREVCRVDEDTVYSRYIYLKCDANDEVPEYVRIRKNGGEWQEPLVEI